MTALSAPCSSAVEDAFGPVVATSCLAGFDFTLLFEESILTILPLGVAVIWAFQRLFILSGETAKVRRSWPLAVKTLFFAVYVALQVVLLVLWTDQGVTKTRLTITCLALTIAGYLILWVVSYLEHTRSVRPSTVVSVYLGISLLLDIARTRTLFFISGGHTVAAVFLASLLTKLVLLLLEISEKRSLIRPRWQNASPEATGGVYNRALFIWLNRLFVDGFRAYLTVDGLSALDEELLAASGPSRLMESWERADKSDDNALLWAFLLHYRWNLLAGVLPRLAYMGFLFAQPFLVETVLDFVAEPNHLEAKSTAYGLVAAYGIVYIGIAISYAVYQHKTYRVLTMFRGSLITLIYGKTLHINSSAIADAEAITLMSADIDRIGHSMPLLHEVYASFVEIAIALWLLYRLLGVAMVGAILWIVVCLAAGLPLAKLAGDAQIPWLEAIEERLAVTAKALGAMKAVKMTGLAEMVGSKVRDLRSSEIRASFRYRALNIFVTISYYAGSALAPVWGFGVYILLARARNTETLSSSVAFAALSLFELLNQPLIHVVDGLEHIQTVVNSFNRIQQYLMSDEREDHRISPGSVKPLAFDSSSSQESESGHHSVVSLKELNSSMDNSTTAAILNDASAGYSQDGPSILKDLTFDVPQGKTTVIFGPVGSGKSTVLKLLLGELAAKTGSVSTAFSRAAFCPQSPWIIWGTIRSNITGLSAWEQPWYDTVTRACALTADFKELPLGDETNTGTSGSRLSGGQQMRVSFARALYSRNPVMILDDVLTGLDRTTERRILDAVFGPTGLLKQLGTTVVLATNSASHLQYADHIVILDEGKVAQQGTWESLSAAGNWQHLQQSTDQPLATTSRPELELGDEAREELEMLEFDKADAARRTGDMKIYAYYAKVAGWGKIAVYLAACATFVFGVLFPSVWLQLWTDSNEKYPNQYIGYYLGVYGALAGVTMLGCALADCVFNLRVVPETARKFHELLLTTTMRAKTSFLTSTDAGNTINRFSQDLELIDNDLPKAADQTVFQFLSAIFSGILVFIGSGYASIAIPLCLVCLALIQFFYLRTSRQLRLLDIEAKAPLFSHFLETLSGVACIRAYGWTEQYSTRNRAALDTSQRPYYLMWCIQRWLTLVLDLFVAGLAVLLVALATNVSSGATGFLGVSLFNVVTFSTTLQLLVQEWTQVETAVGAVSRIRSYVLSVQDENRDGEDGAVDDNWPRNGAVAFQGVEASYDASPEPTLKQVSLAVRPGEKVAICGRSGSGKSTLVSTLLRLLDLDAGTITVDGVDISTLSREEVRRHITTVSQEPFFLHGTLRENMDPFHRAEDTRIESVLRTVGLWEQLAEARGGEDELLDGDMEEETLSHGQRQLLCLARAAVRPGQVVVMDEAMSSVDAETEGLMQRVVDEEFRGCTLLSVAHKLHTVLHFDRVVVLDKGSVVEVGNPMELLDVPTSAFKKLYDSMSGGSA
ncbi:ABC multidrug transporter [Whalleya microplaca]|nr:ABC multidrug transporter [Whalleya microplaca]